MQTTQPLDLTACDKEPIHIPGLIQGFGALLVLRPQDLSIQQASANLDQVLGIVAEEAVGRMLEDVIGAHACAALRDALSRGALHAVSPTLVHLPGERAARECYMQYNMSGGALLAEFEPAGDRAGTLPGLQGELPFRAINTCASAEALCGLLAREMRRLTGFDRCIAYRFDEDWHGVVIAEDRNEVYRESFLGHHFPASDIPAQARKLFTLNHLRLIPDVSARPVPLHPPYPSPDMSYSTLRSAAPVHLEYLGNMGVRASLTVSLMCGDRLWGMLTCHHATPHMVPVATRLRCKALAEIASYAVATIESGEAARMRAARTQALRQVQEALAAGTRFQDAVQEASGQMLEALGADTLLLNVDGVSLEFGAALPQRVAEPVRAALQRELQGVVTHSRHLAALDPGLADIAPVASGALYCRLDQAGSHFLALRREVVEARNWAGNPDKPVDAPDGRLHPRKSFALWQEAVRNRSQRWLAVDTEAALELRRMLLERREQIARKEFEGALRAERDRSSGILEAMAEGFALVDRDLRILQVNTEGLRLGGRDAGEAAGRTLTDFWPQAFPEQTMRVCRQVLAQRGHAVLEQEVLSGSRPLWLDIRLYPSGEGLAIFFRDVSDRKTMEAALRDVNGLLEERVAARTRELEHAHQQLHQSQKMEALGQLTGGIAHDFNNLLASIVSSMEIMSLRLQQGRTDGLERYVDTASTATGRAASLIQRLLSFARQQSLKPVQVDINQLVDGVADLVQRAIGPAIRLELRLAAELWPVACDPNQLENALLNLAINARDAMPGGGTLTVETRKLVIGESQQEKDMPPGEYAMLSVSDTGTGMPPDVAARAFDPFFTTKAVGKGTGLGLSMVYGFVRQSGGDTRIFSEAGKGTTIRICLPRSRQAQDAGAEAASSVAPAHAALRDADVLLVEDETQLRTLLREMLQDIGCRVVEAGDAEEAFALLRKGNRIDMLISDVGLPGSVDGNALVKQVLADRPGLAALLISGYGDQQAASGTVPMLAKPFALSAFVARVLELLPAPDAAAGPRGGT
ncbi:MAG TPA: ATP-binding protein [Noviherbaspirillum sp.]|jgi:PAS domain S-box-containing protein|uniref:ATP-binding protein n=1 Tax=Noviherbaspirillum sp. TaxID=1926288 RepID=UPI002F94E3A8